MNLITVEGTHPYITLCKASQTWMQQKTTLNSTQREKINQNHKRTSSTPPNWKPHAFNP